METAHELESVHVCGEEWREGDHKGWKGWFAGFRVGHVFSLLGETV